MKKIIIFILLLPLFTFANQLNVIPTIEESNQKQMDLNASNDSGKEKENKVKSKSLIKINSIDLSLGGTESMSLYDGKLHRLNTQGHFLGIEINFNDKESFGYTELGTNLVNQVIIILIKGILGSSNKGDTYSPIINPTKCKNIACQFSAQSNISYIRKFDVFEFGFGLGFINYAYDYNEVDIFKRYYPNISIKYNFYKSKDFKKADYSYAGFFKNDFNFRNDKDIHIQDYLISIGIDFNFASSVK